MLDVQSRKRVGKTRKDRESGATARNASNKAERTIWMRDSDATVASFPRHTCNGKKNRFRVTGKNNTVKTS